MTQGGRLTVLLGNHDIELSLPSVRTAFRHALGVKPGHDFEFLYDGEAYVVGDALIEHGNRYDAWNQIDLDSLRRVRSLLSRRQDIPERYRFDPPAGSHMVASVINTIKIQYPFIDLLKPEEAAVVPILLALEPAYRSRLAAVAALAYRTLSHGLDAPAMPKFGGDIRSERHAGHVQPAAGLGDKNSAHSFEFGADVATGRMSQSPRVPASRTEAALQRAVRTTLGEEANDFFQEISTHTASTRCAANNWT